jgi:hypothetical protein
MNNYYVYQLIDPRTGIPFYVGKGTKQRAWSHLTFNSGCYNPHKDRIIKKIQSLGLEVIVDIVESNLTTEVAEQNEELLIEKIGLDKLSNICPSAHPPVLTGAANGFYGKKHTDETKVLCGNANRGKDLKSIEGKKSIATSLSDRWADPAQRANQILALQNRKGEKRSAAAIESYKISAAKRNANMTPEQRSARSLAGCATRKINSAGLKRKSYIDDAGKKRFKWIPATD